jgi:hypothetical protein
MNPLSASTYSPGLQAYRPGARTGLRKDSNFAGQTEGVISTTNDQEHCNEMSSSATTGNVSLSKPVGFDKRR